MLIGWSIYVTFKQEVLLKCKCLQCKCFVSVFVYSFFATGKNFAPYIASLFIYSFIRETDHCL